MEDNKAVFPYTQGEKTRLFLPDGERKFFFTPGVSPPLYNLEDALKHQIAFLVEGETDTMRLWQELGPDATSGVLGLSGLKTWKPEMANALESLQRVFVLLDNDDAYSIASQDVETAWRNILSDLGRSKAKRIRLPLGVKDMCEFFETYDLDTLRLLAKKGLGVSTSRYRPLDFTKPPPEPDWLLDGMVAKGDVNLGTGPPGLGKSWFCMGLAVAIVEAHPDFLGAEIKQGKHGRVLYVDQENPQDVVYRRLRQLGLTERGRSSLRYLWNQNIRVDRNPEDFIEEALDFEPDLIVLDSLTRIHTQDENSAGSMAALFNDALQPLARETGAAVFLVHHDNKQGNPRGSIDITASPDGVIHFRGYGDDNPGTFVMRQGKSRRRLGGDELIVRIEDGPDGSVELVANPKLDPPF